MLNMSVKREAPHGKSKKMSNSKRLKRQLENEEEEFRLSKLLFDNGEGLLENLNNEDLDQDILDQLDSDTDERKPAWNDEEDEDTTVGKALNAQNRVLPEGGINDRGNKYSNLLKEKFKTVYGTPKWASLDREAEEGSDDEILRSNKHIVKSKAKNLPKNVLDIKRMKDLNKDTYSEGPIVSSVDFHKGSSVALAAGLNGVVSIYAVDGRENEKLHTLGYNRYPIHNAKFSQDGEEVILGGQHSYYHCYNLMSGDTKRIMLPHKVTQMKIYELSPCGKYIAIGGRFGEVFVLSSKSKELLCTMKQATKCTGMAFSEDGARLYCHGSENEVTVFDMKERKAMKKFLDDGCLAGSCIDLSRNGQYLATALCVIRYKSSIILPTKDRQSLNSQSRSSR
ncbi:U3 small nucleolar RNA-associated protein 18 homolog isoform X2 [Ctenocephalides felis]|uniref:U3 small nucleolar RNA-associated protein 18 homolog isoform X2 n=1 Tax=Ctenocephalides felis TaxID=7515 RepID=UPI000E6E2AB4|nr:U3 small nucleolar RNA-associated protein 18 homolog isoform X2 [Ctenocephalides felis]